jgi:hypothetical protein
MKLILFSHFKPFKRSKIKGATSCSYICRKKLGRRQQGMQPRRDIMANSRKLSDLEEEKLVEYILTWIHEDFRPG